VKNEGKDLLKSVREQLELLELSKNELRYSVFAHNFDENYVRHADLTREELYLLTRKLLIEGTKHFVMAQL
jgi:hypothetical protein